MSNNDYETVLSSSEELDEFLLKNKWLRMDCSSRLSLLRFYTSGLDRQPLSELYEIIWHAHFRLLTEVDFDKTFAFVDLADIMVLD